MEELLTQYGIAGVVLAGAAKGIQMLYKNMREDMKTARSDSKEMFNLIQKRCEEREERIIEVMEKQSEALKEINSSVVENTNNIQNNNNELQVIKRLLEEFKNKEAG